MLQTFPDDFIWHLFVEGIRHFGLCVNNYTGTLATRAGFNPLDLVREGDGAVKKLLLFAYFLLRSHEYNWLRDMLEVLLSSIPENNTLRNFALAISSDENLHSKLDDLYRNSLTHDVIWRILIALLNYARESC